MEFLTASQPAMTEKPSTLAIKGSSSFVDNVGNPHIVGSIINQGQSPEKFLNLVATFYDNSRLGVVGTQSFGLKVGSLANNQAAPFAITITDNKTKSQAAFYSLNVDSAQSSMSPTLNPKGTFGAHNTDTGQFITGGEFINPFLSIDQDTNQNIQPSNNNDNDNDNDNNDNDNDNDNQRGEQRRDDDGNPWFDDDNCSEEAGSSGGDLSECEEAEREEQNEHEDEDTLDDSNDSNNAGDDQENNNNEADGNGEDNNDEYNWQIKISTCFQFSVDGFGTLNIVSIIC